MSQIVRSDPKLWEKVKKEVQGNKKWNARIAQQSVLEYKRRGGRYEGDQSKSSLHKWTKEDWGYIPNSKRYLPKKVRETLTTKEMMIASKGKRLGTRKKYPVIINKRMKELGIY